ncbi:hypothetical protein V6259_12910 [Marinomonas sp. TI.3.20]|uniref:hypothetical protein n=1 Tax=Marinomonas sp. TI.3.20 TaxID=3121296 RepID=UPI00311ED016
MSDMSTHETKAIKAFKSFISRTASIDLDFRVHGYLSNNHGGYPQYSYDIAKKVVDGMFEFFTLHNVDFKDRYNSDMCIDELRTTPLKTFLVCKLTAEITEEVIDAVATGSPESKMVITSVEILDIDSGGDETSATDVSVDVVATDVADETQTFTVQLTDGDYRSDLGCWITTVDSGGDIDCDDYPFFDMSVIIKAAENAITERFTLTYIKDGIYLQKDLETNECELLEENHNFINPDQSSYQNKWDKLLGTFDTEDEALEFIKTL